MNLRGIISQLESTLKPLEADMHVLEHRLAAIHRGDDFENDPIRIHRYDRSIAVWDLTNAGKRGKEVKYFSIEVDSVSGPEEDLLNDLEKSTSFAHAHDLVKAFMKEYPDCQIHERNERGVDIAPAGFKPVHVQGKGVTISADYDSFQVKDRDDPNEETCIPAIKGGKADIKVFYRWVKDNETKLKTMNFDDVIKGMNDEGIRYHRYCAMD